MGVIENVSEEESKLIQELKKNFEHELPPALLDDSSLYYRFLKVSDFNIKSAETLLRKHIQYRKKSKLDEILDTYSPPHPMSEYFSINFLGYDDEGAIICYTDLGSVDHRGMLTLFTSEQLILNFIICVEREFKKFRERNKKAENVPPLVTILINMDKFNLFQSTYKKGIEAFYEGVKTFLENYPEIIKSIYIINASFYFHFAYSLIKPILGSKVIQRIHIFSNDDWKDVLLQAMSADVLPAFLGGNRTDPDGNPMCNSFIVHGKKVPPELYSTKKKTIAKDKDVKKLTLHRSSFSEIEININEENTNIEWEFETKTKDIGFGLYFKRFYSKEISEAIIPLERIDTALASEIGMFKCNSKGTYIIVFDNSYSWFTSKELYYRIKVVKPEKDAE